MHVFKEAAQKFYKNKHYLSDSTFFYCFSESKHSTESMQCLFEVKRSVSEWLGGEAFIRSDLDLCVHEKQVLH